MTLGRCRIELAKAVRTLRPVVMLKERQLCLALPLALGARLIGTGNLSQLRALSAPTLLTLRLQRLKLVV